MTAPPASPSAAAKIDPHFLEGPSTAATVTEIVPLDPPVTFFVAC
ncbi:hypothetical protein [Zafaria sp. J156]|nr:hypothetical protein [Zafaria sp. J156]